MIRKLLFIIICSFICFTASAQALISGTVTDTTGAPVQYHIVNVFVDSLAGWHVNTHTDANGHYEVTVPANVSGNFIFIYLYSCNYNTNHNYPYTGANISAVNFTICPPPAPITGKVSLDATGTGAADAIVYLINQKYDTPAMTYILTAIDTTYTDANGNYTLGYHAGGNTLLVKAALLPAAAGYNNYLPAYYTSSISWSSATAVTQPLPALGVNISLPAAVNAGGPGFIGGDVQQGANKATSVGDPLEKRVLLLTNMSNAPVAYTYSDAAGHFTFNNLAYGPYKLFGDAVGKQNPALIINLSAAMASINDIIFEENSDVFEGHSPSLSVQPIANASNVSLYPNPAKDNIYVRGLDAVHGAKTIRISSMTGTVVYEHSYNEGETLLIPLAGLSSAVYVVNIHTTEGNQRFKLVK